MKKSIMKKLRGLGCLMLALLPVSASALLIQPDSTSFIASGPENSMSAINAVISSTYGVDLTTLQFRANTDGTETGPVAGDYHAVFSNSVADPSDADIIWDGPGYVNGAEFLLVKDGNHSPGWYLFDISGWDGMETISLRGFWPAGGAISNVGFYGGVHVPEPDTLALLGVGLLAIGLMRRRKAA